jgi:ribosomal protein L6P/L9E
LNSTGIVSIFSISLLKATQVANEIIRYRKTEVYKGKGISLDTTIFLSKKERK